MLEGSPGWPASARLESFAKAQALEGEDCQWQSARKQTPENLFSRLFFSGSPEVTESLIIVIYGTEGSPSGLWRTLGKRVGRKPSRVRIPLPPPGEEQSDFCLAVFLLWKKRFEHPSSISKVARRSMLRA